MSNDLISRSALLEEINNFSMRITGSANAMAITIMEETKKSIEKLIDEQPTAYNVDKVVERLEEEARYNQSEANELAQHGDYGTATMFQGIAKGYKYSADIVKSGGVE